MQHADGRVAAWLMNGLAVGSGGVVGALGAGWDLAAVGDIGGDGRADLVLRNAGGAVAAWQMDGLAIAGGTAFASLPSDWLIVQ